MKEGGFYLNKIEGKITGITFFKIPEETWNKLQVGVILTLKRDTDNQYDANAVQILYNRKQIGWVDKQDNAIIASALDKGTIITTTITRIFGTPADRPHLEIEYTWEQ